MIRVAVDTVPEGAIGVRLVTDADRDAGATGKTLTLKWIKAGASSWTTLTVTTQYTVTEGASGIYWITFVDTDLFDTVGGAVLEVTATDADEYYERFDVFTPANVDAVPATLSTAYLNKIADHVLRRAMDTARASSDGDTVEKQSLLGALSKLVNKTALSGTTLTVYQEDNTTSFFTQTVTTDADADPVTSVT